MAPRLNIPPLTRSLFICLITLTFLNATIQPDFTPLSPFTRTGNGSPYLTIIPAISWSFPWTFATATLVEQNLFGLVITGLTLFFGGRYLERAYGSAEYAKYILFTALIPNLFCFAIYLLFYAVSGSEKALTATISGAIAIQGAFLVSFKQLIPEHAVTFAKVIRIRVKHFPALFLLLNTLSAIIFGTETAGMLAWLGFMVSWTYLRFYRYSPAITTATGGESASVKGDASDTFSFASFFPDVTHPFINPITNSIYSILVALRICTAFTAEDIEASNDAANSRAEGGLPSIMGGRGSGRREEAERRRALALAALDQRLSAASARPPANASVALAPRESASAMTPHGDTEATATSQPEQGSGQEQAVPQSQR